MNSHMKSPCLLVEFADLAVLAALEIHSHRPYRSQPRTWIFIYRIYNTNYGILYIIYTLWLFNIAMENCPFIDDFPTKTSIYQGFSMAMLNNQRVLYTIHN